jgi:hypothetical protein
VKANSPSVEKVTISQNSFHYEWPCSNHAEPALPEQPFDCAGDVRVKPTAAAAVLLLSGAIAGAGTQACAQTGPQTGPSAARSRSGHSAPQPRSLPLVLPEPFAPPQEVYASFPDSGSTAAAPAAPSACQLRLAKIALFQALGTLVGPGDCGAADAMELHAVILPDQSKVAVTPPATLRCSMAEQVANWLRDDVAPAFAETGPPVRVLDNFDSYECRGRNRVRAAALSEHGRADALDVRGFRLADGHEINLTDVGVAKDLRGKIRASVCARFSTVLGPGSDGYHEEHVHLDLAERHNGYKLCQWEVREPPAPATAQAEARAPSDQESEQSKPPAEATAQVPLPRPRPLAANLNRTKKYDSR